MTEPRAGRSRAAGAALAVLVLGLLAWLLLASPLFRISTIDVIGNRSLDDERIRSLSGAAAGESLILLSTDAVERAMESSPWVRRARVTRSFPDTLVIRIREREAIAVGDDPGGTVLVADDGIVLARREEASLPSIGQFPRTLAPGDLVPGGADALRVLASLDPSVRRRIDSVETEDGGLVLLVSDGGAIRYGSPADLARKGTAAEAVLAWAEDRRIEFAYIDVSAPESPVLRPRGRGRNELEPTIDAAS